MLNCTPLASYLISGVYLPFPDVTHYIVHENNEPGISGGKKMTKDEVIALVENSGLPVYVFEWNYDLGHFIIGKRVNCNLDYHGNKYLWINEKDRRTKDLRHLINMEWFNRQC